MDYRTEIENLTKALTEAIVFDKSITPLLLTAVHWGFSIEINPSNMNGVLEMTVATGPKTDGPMRWSQSVMFDPKVLSEILTVTNTEV